MELRDLSPEHVTPRTMYSMTFESSGKENNPAIAAANEDVKVVVTSFAKRPFRPAARPLPIARYIQLAVMVGDVTRSSELRLGLAR